MMKATKLQIQNILSSAFLLSAVMLSGCQKEGDMDQQYTVGKPSKYVSFTTSLGPMEASTVSQTKTALMSSVVEEWPLVEEQPVTKGSPLTSFRYASGDAMSAGIIGFVDSEVSPTISKKKFNFDNESLTADSSPITWNSLSAGTTLHVFAYAPYNEFNSAVTASTKQIAYTVPSDVADQQDLIVAAGDATISDKVSVPLTFTHALSAVRFKTAFECWVKSISIQNVSGTGTYTIGGDWSSLGTANQTYTIDFDTRQHIEADNYIAEGTNTFILIPQSFDGLATAQVVMTYYESGSSEELKTFTASIKNHEWPVGKRVTYTLNKTVVGDIIYFDLAAGSVSIDASHYDGYVYELDSKTRVRVYGNHNSVNQYYVYQSSSIDKIGVSVDNPGYYGRCGFRNGAKRVSGQTYTDGKDHDEKVVTLPAYSRVTAPGGTMSWSDYITNAPGRGLSVENIIEAWPARAAAVGRESTRKGDITAGTITEAASFNQEYRISISGNVGICNLTIDNIYTRYHDCNNTGTAKERNTDGAIRFNDEIDGSYSNGAYSGNTIYLNIIGDNRVGNVFYRSQQTSNNRMIFNGSGSLTVADSDRTNAYESSGSYHMNHYGAAIGPNDLHGNVYDPLNNYRKVRAAWGLVFESGVIYAGTTTADFAGAIGGGGNGDAGITIKGGKVTADSGSRGAAIGGGYGGGGFGGEGTVTIEGGNVYAYNSLLSEPGAAIGGGGSSNNASDGIVTITGGNVFAKSNNGTAIGGGSSYNKVGGGATVTIEGGNIEAISSNGLGIGGGTGCFYPGSNGDYKGGDATIIIHGGNILTGSIGGGATNDARAPIGSANVTITDGDIQAQFVMAAGASTTPSFTMSGGRIRNSATDDSEYVHIKESGGAVYLEAGTFLMSGGVIQNCSATVGGAVHVNGGTFTMTNGTIQNCESSSHGGAIYLQGGAVSISGGSIVHNNASGNSACGGGLYINRGSFSMPEGSTGLINSNHANYDGGGVYVTSVDSDVTVGVLSGRITGNTSAYRGGGLCVLPAVGYAANITLGIADQGDLNPEITGNEAVVSGGGLYAAGTDANVHIYSGKIKNNRVSSYVVNQDVANELGMVTLYGGDVDYRTVTFNANGGVGADQIQKIVTATNTHLQVPAAAQLFTKADHHLTGWNTLPGGGGTSYAINATDVMNISENITLYAQWAAN